MDIFPSADLVARAIMAGCAETGADPIAVASGDTVLGGPKGNVSLSRARAYAAFAIKKTYGQCGAPAIARMVGARNSASSYIASLEHQRRNGGLKWFDDGALLRVVKSISVVQNPTVTKLEVAPPAKAKTPGRFFFKNGIKIDFTEGRETIYAGTQFKEITHRQALFFEALAAGMPNPIGRDFLRQKLFGAARASMHDVQLDLIAKEARVLALSIGLNIGEVKGIGFNLVRPQ